MAALHTCSAVVYKYLVTVLVILYPIVGGYIVCACVCMCAFSLSVMYTEMWHCLHQSNRSVFVCINGGMYTACKCLSQPDSVLLQR